MKGNTSVILVGNGPSVLDFKMGAVVDSHDIVVRFNRFKIKGYEDHVGTRTDFWFTVTQNSKRAVRGHKFKRTYWWKYRGGGLARFRNSFPSAINIDQSVLAEIQKTAMVFDYHRWSTGAIAAQVLLKEFPRLSLIGFDWWTGNARHHYGDNHGKGDSHQPQHELQFFRSLASTGQVVDLNPASALHPQEGMAERQN